MSVATSRRPRILPLLGPAFVAAIAYVDPGNVAANIAAGARYGYLLVWVLVVANVMAGLVQFQSAKLGLVTGQTLPELVGVRLRRPARLAFWLQAEVVAAATEVAEVIGGAIALYLLFGTPLLLGGFIVGAVSMVLLTVQNRLGQRPFELVVIGMLVIITIGFVTGVVVKPPPPGEVARGLVPHFAGTGSILLATSMLGATVMPHAIYVHSALVRDRHGGAIAADRLRHLLHATRLDVIGALVVASVVNIAMLLLAASNLRGVAGADTIQGAHAGLVSVLSPGIGLLFAVALLASGLASTLVGCYAGATILQGLIHWQVPLLVRRLVTIVPALVVLGTGVSPTWAMVISQVVLSFGIPFALIPLLRLTSDRNLMGEHANSPMMNATMTIIVAMVVLLNVALLVMTVS